MTAKILIAYASMSGNTEEIADLIKSSLEINPIDIEIKEIEHMNAEELLQYDGIILGSYTWGDGELPYETEDFYEGLLDVDLTDKVVAVFGSGDTAYPKFCAAVDLLEERLQLQGASLAVEGLRIEFTPDTDEEVESCANFAVMFAEKLGV
ncbi:flavodoxin [Bacillus alkalisoli]|uniref:flavodoxin n=1 Tax=Bacillus alkalisoli TaxID=2011008 RepID=UPI000C242272|nr:flavodoxin [Bacillus alkalisoli]